MIIIPEIETVVILVPRTGSGSLRRAIAARYSASFLLYRHMESDGVPLGYDRWRRVGVVRQPVDRLWSLYHFLRDFGGNHDHAFVERMRRSVMMPFGEWLVHNDVPFSTPYDSNGARFWPAFACRHPIAENRKSQFLYLRPDLGTTVYRYDDMAALYQDLDLPWDASGTRHNHTDAGRPPWLPDYIMDCVRKRFAWDLHYTRGLEP